MKGKDTFTAAEIKQLEDLIALRVITPSSGQKIIRDKMRAMEFYGKDDWGIVDLQISNLRSLIKSGQIKVIGASNIRTLLPPNVLKTTTEKKPKDTAVKNLSSDINVNLEGFKLNRFDPTEDSETKIDNQPGNYLLCLRKKSKLPNSRTLPIYTSLEGLEVIYTGIAGGSLRTRDYRQHCKGNNAGRSTLRKSLGVLFGYKLIPRDKDTFSGKTKFNEHDEQELTKWMHLNLIMFFLPTLNFNDLEIKLIDKFNPPLNLKDNHNNHYN